MKRKFEVLHLVFTKIKLNFSFDIDFVSFPKIPLKIRLLYILQKYLTLILGRRQIPYLGINFFYDNFWTPALLQYYPREVLRLGNYLNPSTVTTLLDIGANIGQFSATWRYFHPHTKIYSFEPNRLIFPILQKNVCQTQHWTTYPLAIGEKAGNADFYFVENKSAQGSFHILNAEQNLLAKDVTKTKVEIVALDRQTLEKLGIPAQIDLIKIDTEGSEEQVLLGLLSIEWRYLYIECSNNRVGALSEARLWELVSMGGRASPKLIFKSAHSSDLSTFDVIIENLAYPAA